MSEYIYYAPGFTSIQEIEEAHGTIYDATTLSKIASCPRKHQIRVEENLEQTGQSPKMAAGIAMHEGMEWYYAHENRTRRVEEESIILMVDTWNEFNIERGYMTDGELHLSPEHLTAVMENYFHTWKYELIDIYEPLHRIKGVEITVESLNLDKVLAARFKLTDTGNIIIGESNIIMQFEIEGDTFILAGKPDLPVIKQNGNIYVMDHKTSSLSVSEWWSRQFQVSNKLRGYMAMINELLSVETCGAVINGIYVGKYATKPKSKTIKFNRFQYTFSPDHVYEALRNQHMWIKTIEFYRAQDYFPQGCGWTACDHPDLCRCDPPTRGEVKMTHYTQSDRHFWNL
jgi:hypothetical protein